MGLGLGPVITHFELARQALLAGKHVFVEKPPAQSSAEADELYALAEERGYRADANKPLDRGNGAP